MSSILLTSQISKNYCDAVFNTIDDPVVQKNLALALELLCPVLSSCEAMKIWRSPSVSQKFKHQLLNQLITSLPSQLPLPELKAILSLMLDHDRLDCVKKLHQLYCTYLDRADGIKRGKLFLADPLPKEQIQPMIEVFEQVFNCKLKLKVIVDPSLYAGFKIYVENSCYDGSLSSVVNNLINTIKH